MTKAGELLKQLFQAFPGLDNGQEDVNGADLVDWLNDNRDEIIKAIEQDK